MRNLHKYVACKWYERGAKDQKAYESTVLVNSFISLTLYIICLLLCIYGLYNVYFIIFSHLLLSLSINRVFRTGKSSPCLGIKVTFQGKICAIGINSSAQWCNGAISHLHHRWDKYLLCIEAMYCFLFFSFHTTHSKLGFKKESIQSIH